MRMTRRDRSIADLRAAQRDHSRAVAHRRDASKTLTLDKKSLLDGTVSALEVGVGAAAAGWAAGRLGTTSIGSTGIPFGLAIGAVGLGLSAFNILPDKVEPHVSNVSAGVIAAWAALWGAGQGSQSRAQAGGAPGGIVAGVPAAIAGAPAMMGYRAPMPGLPAPMPFAAPQRTLSEAELQALAHAIPIR